MMLSVELTEEKKKCRADRLDEYVEGGWIAYKELESLIGRLSFSQTSVFGRFGRALMQPLHRKLKAPVFPGRLTHSDRLVFQWWAWVLLSVCPRYIFPRLNTHQFIIYTDAATSTRILSSVIFNKGGIR